MKIYIVMFDDGTNRYIEEVFKSIVVASHYANTHETHSEHLKVEAHELKVDRCYIINDGEQVYEVTTCVDTALNMCKANNKLGIRIKELK